MRLQIPKTPLLDEVIVGDGALSRECVAAGDASDKFDILFHSCVVLEVLEYRPRERRVRRPCLETN